MQCDHEVVTTTYLDDEVKRSQSSVWRIRKECENCHLRIYTTIQEAKKV